MADSLTVALITEVFWQDDGPERLRERLMEAKKNGAALAVLPELALNSWCAATKEARDEDAEAPGGPRHQVQAAAAREVGIGLVGAAIVRDRETGVRRNTALTFDAQGELISTFAKIHLPEEPAYWETSHYEPGDALAPIVRAFGVPFGVQICSDINRPEGSHLIGAMGGMAVVNPRATEEETYWKWRPVFIANALTSRVYVISVNRSLEEGAGIGGPSLAVAPSGKVLVETTDPVAVATLESGAIAEAGAAYPGYLPVRSDLYAEGWRGVPSRRVSHL